MATPKAVLLDIEGTLSVGGRAIPGAVDVLRQMRDAGMGLRFVTNIDSRSPATIATELARAGIPVDEREVFSPVAALGVFLADHQDARLELLMRDELASLFAAHAATVGDPATHVVVGDCRPVLDYEHLNRAFRHLHAGAHLVALQRGRFFAEADGLSIDTGAIVAALEYATGQEATLLGKPSPEFFGLALDDLDVRGDETVMVGDDVEADIAGGAGVGATTVLVRTGKFTAAALERATSPPDHVVDSIADLPWVLGVG